MPEATISGMEMIQNKILVWPACGIQVAYGEKKTNRGGGLTDAQSKLAPSQWTLHPDRDQKGLKWVGGCTTLVFLLSPVPAISFGNYILRRIYRRSEKAIEMRSRGTRPDGPGNGNGEDVVSPEQGIALVDDGYWGRAIQ
ncbi:uncharacterized protein N7498_010665 [Penicillium cinerascens]|uniref:Uncharacterized protein n=1 Tax=Penicillium cinerascens TaxID=70096 RepID=A0A9W9M727_9EURO|nr:uncharacterized protein N7498_010665 [Penicillium cinerascens]KAJ5191680.1 hypothetical protein N7498_010665 [Penicillium cinerascens]